MVHFVLFITFTFAERPPDRCKGPLTRETVVQCAVAESPQLHADRARIAVAQGDRAAARVLLPTNPTVGVTVGGRWNTVGDQAVNVTGNLSQSIEIAGQRRKRIEAAREEVKSQKTHALGTERRVIAAALVAYYDVLAARDEVAIVDRAHETAQRLRDVASARAESGLAAPMDAELAAAEALALAERLSLAQGRLHVAQARLAYAVGLDPTGPAPEVRGTLDPLPATDSVVHPSRAPEFRPEIGEAQADRKARLARFQLLRRERAPSPSVSAFAMTDGFNERVVGGGLSIPIPLPFPLGRTNKGQIEAARARIREADHRITAAQRQVLLEAAVARHEFVAHQQAAEAYPPEVLQRTERSLQDLAEEIDRGRLAVRDALLTQQAFINLLLRAVEARHQVCRASVELILAVGIPFDGGEP